MWHSSKLMEVHENNSWTRVNLKTLRTARCGQWSFRAHIWFCGLVWLCLFDFLQFKNLLPFIREKEVSLGCVTSTWVQSHPWKGAWKKKKNVKNERATKVWVDILSMLISFRSWSLSRQKTEKSVWQIECKVKLLREHTTKNSQKHTTHKQKENNKILLQKSWEHACF